MAGRLSLVKHYVQFRNSNRTADVVIKSKTYYVDFICFYKPESVLDPDGWKFDCTIMNLEQCPRTLEVPELVFRTKLKYDGAFYAQRQGKGRPDKPYISLYMPYYAFNFQTSERTRRRGFHNITWLYHYSESHNLAFYEIIIKEEEVPAWKQEAITMFMRKQRMERAKHLLIKKRDAAVDKLLELDPDGVIMQNYITTLHALNSAINPDDEDEDNYPPITYT